MALRGEVFLTSRAAERGIIIFHDFAGFIRPRVSIERLLDSLDGGFFAGG
jgi:hypothetical protein